jgi:GrpB-like predicted nucleotidyltransferase (UPF0157 family)
MPPPIPVVLAAYNPDWPALAARHAERLLGLGSVVAVVHHIGSTAIPGLAAKPIIDLMPLVVNVTALDRARGRIEALGYAWHGAYGMAGRRYCTLCDDAGVRAVQLHFFGMDSPHAVRHIAFRDYLRAHADVARAYEAEKRRARDLHPDDSHSYGHAKSAWIRAVEAAALTWYAGLDRAAREPRERG